MARESMGPRGSFRLYIPLTDHLASVGVDVPALLERAGLPPGVLDDPDTRVHRAPIETLWEEAIDLTGDRWLGLRVGRTVKPETIGLVRYVVEASDSGVDAVERAASLTRYFGDDGVVNVVFERGLAVLQFGNPAVHEITRPIAEYSVSMTVALSRQLGPATTAGAAIDARFRYDASDDRAIYEELLEVPVRFGAPHFGAAFPLASFDAPNPKADPVLRGLLEQHAAELLARIPEEHSFADRVRTCVVDLLPSGSPGVEDVATTLRMSERTVRRRLREEGTTYRDLLDDVRQALARQQLRPGGPSVEEVAYRLGFSDKSGFHKAFRRWTGESPAGYLKTRQAELAKRRSR